MSLKTIKEETPRLDMVEEKTYLDNYQKKICRETPVEKEKHVRFAETKSKKEVLSEFKNSRQG